MMSTNPLILLHDVLVANAEDDENCKRSNVKSLRRKPAEAALTLSNTGSDNLCCQSCDSTTEARVSPRNQYGNRFIRVARRPRTAGLRRRRSFATTTEVIADYETDCEEKDVAELLLDIHVSLLHSPKPEETLEVNVEKAGTVTENTVDEVKVKLCENSSKVKSGAETQSLQPYPAEQRFNCKQNSSFRAATRKSCKRKLAMSPPGEDKSNKAKRNVSRTLTTRKVKLDPSCVSGEIDKPQHITSTADVSGRCKCGKKISAEHPPCKSELTILCERFEQLFGRKEGVGIQLAQAAEKLQVARRRLYDIINVLEAVNLITRTGKLTYTWRGRGCLPDLLSTLAGSGTAQEPCIENNADTPAQSSPTKATSSKLSLWRLTRMFVRLLLTSEAPQTLPGAAKILVETDGKCSRQTVITVERRLYDISSILCALGLTEKLYLGRVQPAFRWLLSPPAARPQQPSRRPVGGSSSSNGSQASRYTLEHEEEAAAQQNGPSPAKGPAAPPAASLPEPPPFSFAIAGPGGWAPRWPAGAGMPPTGSLVWPATPPLPAMMPWAPPTAGMDPWAVVPNPQSYPGAGAFGGGLHGPSPMGFAPPLSVGAPQWPLGCLFGFGAEPMMHPLWCFPGAAPM